ncbi:hypothetical protein KI387_035450, partial [Taxus chinensis]
LEGGGSFRVKMTVVLGSDPRGREGGMCGWSGGGDMGRGQVYTVVEGRWNSGGRVTTWGKEVAMAVGRGQHGRRSGGDCGKWWRAAVQVYSA